MLNNTQKNRKLIPKYLLVSCLIITICAVINGLTQKFNIMYFAFYLSILIALINSSENNVYFISFLIPILSILKLNEDMYSFGTVIILIAFCKHILSRFSKMKISTGTIYITLVLIMYEFMHFNLYELGDKLISIRMMIILLYATLWGADFKFNYSHKLSIWGFTIGLFVSSIYGIVMSKYSSVYVNKLALLENGSSLRFEGAEGDPNYFALNTLLCAFALIYIYSLNKEKDKTNKFYYIAIIFMIVFGSMSISRTFLLILIFGLAIILLKAISDFFKGNTVLMHFLIGALTIIGSFGLFFIKNILVIFNTIIERFTTNDVGQLTSNRNILFDLYVSVLKGDHNILFRGIGLPHYYTRLGLSHGTHNVILELLIAWGIVGFIIFIIWCVMLYYSQKHKYRNGNFTRTILSALPILCIILGYQSLGAIADYSTYFIIVIFMRHIFYDGTENIG